MWDLIVSVPDHCLSFYFEVCLERVRGINISISGMGKGSRP